LGRIESGNERGKVCRPAAAAAAAFVLLLLGSSFLPSWSASAPPRLLAAARGAFLAASLSLSLAFLFRWGRPSSRRGADRAGAGEFPAATVEGGTFGEGPGPENPEERYRELLARHLCTKRMMQARTAGGVYRALMEGIRDGLGHAGAVMAFLDNEGNLVFPPAPSEGEGGFQGYVVPAVSGSSAFHFPLLDADEPRFFEGPPSGGNEEYRAVSGDGPSLAIPLLHRGWTEDLEGEGEGVRPEDPAPRFRPALIVLRRSPGGREPTRDSADPVLSLLAEAETALETTGLYRRLRSLSVTDGLTGLLNHREFYDRLGREADRAKRYSHNLSVLLLDVDDFKGYNDRYGHPAGDKVLRSIASLLRRSARGTDVVARYGGEEFAVILPESSSTGALLMAERIRSNLAEIDFSPDPERSVRLTASLGIYTSETGEAAVDTLVSMADEALYRAKKDGKNRVILRAGK
jgi:diguanylate cyclase (GGDEF)-like protein